MRRRYISPGPALPDHGVVLEGGVVDEAGTEAARARMRQEWHGEAPHFSFGPERDAHERIWTAEAYAAMIEIMMTLRTLWRFFVKTRLFAMLTSPPADAATVVRDAFTGLRAVYPGLRC